MPLKRSPAELLTDNRAEHGPLALASAILGWSWGLLSLWSIHRESGDERTHLTGETVEFFQVKEGQSLQPIPTLGREQDPNDTPILRVRGTRDETHLCRAIDQFTNAVLAEEQVVGKVSD